MIAGGSKQKEGTKPVSREQGKVGKVETIEDSGELDTLFGSILNLLKSILLFPFYIYTNLMEKIVRFFFKMVFLAIKIAE
jgi:hypothetical protein